MLQRNTAILYIRNHSQWLNVKAGLFISGLVLSPHSQPWISKSESTVSVLSFSFHFISLHCSFLAILCTLFTNWVVYKNLQTDKESHLCSDYERKMRSYPSHALFSPHILKTASPEMMNLPFTSQYFLLSAVDLSVNPNGKNVLNHSHLAVQWLQHSAAYFWLGGGGGCHRICRK